MKKTTITEKQRLQFNRMPQSLKQIKAFQSPDKLRKNSEKDWGLSFEESIEMAYENMQETARNGCHNIKPNTPPTHD